MSNMREPQWLALAETEDIYDISKVVSGINPSARIQFMDSANALRTKLLELPSKSSCVIIAPQISGVSGINIAAALSRDKRAQQVMLAGHKVSGSMRSRATQAGIDMVVDLDEYRLAAYQRTSPVQGRSDGGLPTSALEPRRTQRHPVISFCSGRGGVGKSSLVALAAGLATTWNLRVGLIDLDLSFGNLYHKFGLSELPDLTRFLGVVKSDREQLGCSVAKGDLSCNRQQYLSHTDDGQTQEVIYLEHAARPHEQLFLIGPCRLPEESELVFAEIAQMIESLSSQLDVVFIDCPTTITDGCAQALQSSDRVLLVGDNDNVEASGINRVASFAIRLGVARTRLVRLDNFVTPKQKNKVHLVSDQGLEAVHIYKVFDGGADFSDALMAGETMQLLYSDNPCVSSMRELVGHLLRDLGCISEKNEQAHKQGLSRSGGANSQREKKVGWFHGRREAK